MGKKTTKTTSTSTPWAPAQPILTGAGNQILSNVQANQGNLNNQESQLNGQLPGLYAQASNPAMLQGGSNYINSVLSPGYLQTGQAQAQALGDYAGQQAGNQVNSAFSQAGRTGSGNHATDLARGVTQAELAPMLQNLQYNQGMQNQAAGMLPSYQDAQFAGYTPYFQGMQLAGQLPYYGSNSLGNVGSLFNGFGTQSGTQPGGWGTDLLNAAASAGSAAIMASDRRLKTNLKLLGRAKDGLGVWEWNWKRDPNGERTVGVIADEVKVLRPHAYVPNYRDGFDGVNYAALGDMS